MGVIQERIVNQGHGSLSASYFCVHSTANPGATAANHVSLWSRGYAYAVHLVSDWTTAYHTVPYDRLCWQVGNGNRFVEGLEICEATNRTDFDRGIRIAAQVVRERLKAHGWGIDRLICHAEASSKWGGSDHTDPLPYFAKWGYSWNKFKQLVKNGSEGEDMSQADVNLIKDKVVKNNGALGRLEARPTHIVFQYGSALGIANIMAGTYELFGDSNTWRVRKALLERTGYVLKEWREYTHDKKSNEIKAEDLAGFGVRIGGSK